MGLECALLRGTLDKVEMHEFSEVSSKSRSATKGAPISQLTNRVARKGDVAGMVIIVRSVWRGIRGRLMIARGGAMIYMLRKWIAYDSLLVLVGVRKCHSRY